MDQNKIELMAEELANFVNKIVNVPLLNEEEERVLFELVFRQALKLVLGNKKKDPAI